MGTGALINRQYAGFRGCMASAARTMLAAQIMVALVAATIPTCLAITLSNAACFPRPLQTQHALESLPMR